MTRLPVYVEARGLLPVTAPLKARPTLREYRTPTPPIDPDLPNYEEFKFLLEKIRATQRVKVALFRYLTLRMVGAGEKDAISIAAAEGRVSRRYLEKTIRSLKDDLREALERLGEEIARRRRRNYLGSLSNS